MECERGRVGVKAVAVEIMNAVARALIVLTIFMLGT